MHVLRSEKRREESVASVVVAVTSGEILGDPEGAALIKTKRKATVTAYQSPLWEQVPVGGGESAEEWQKKELREEGTDEG